jgi:hypothetical protein
MGSRLNFNIKFAETVLEYLLITYIILVFGLFLSFFLCNYLSEACHDCLPGLRVPFGDLGGIAVGNNGNIYFGIGMFSRIQVYDTNGIFLKGWFVPDPGISLFVDCNDNLNYLGYRQRIKLVYDSNGTILDHERVTDKYILNVEPESDYEATDDFGNSYRIESRFFFPRIAKVTPAGEVKTLIEEPIFLTPFRFPFPSIPIMAMAGIPLSILRFLRRKLNKKQSLSTA